MEYTSKSHVGEIADGEWLVEGARYHSPSAAAGGAAVTRSGKHPSLDAWEYWWVKLPGTDRWVSLNSLRHR
jgi:hypothetical protein